MERQSINEKFMKIMSLALEISPADKEVKYGEPQVFVNYSPHVISLEVTVYLNGWIENKKADYRAGCYGYQNNVCEQANVPQKRQDLQRKKIICCRILYLYKALMAVTGQKIE